jgi:hypothetical protein
LAHTVRLSALLFVFALLLAVAPVAARPDAVTGGGVQGLMLEEHGLQFTLAVPAYQVDRGGLVSAPHLEAYGATPGAPALPYYSAFVALPPEATARVTVRAAETSSRTLAGPVMAAPRPGAVERSSPGNDELLGVTGLLAGDYTPDPELYGRDALYPESVYRLSEPMYFRDLRVVRLDLYPLRYNPARSLLEHSPQLDVSIVFAGARLDALRPAPTPDDRYARTLQGSLLNPEQAASWRSLPAAPSVPEPGLPIGQESYKIAVVEDGIYEIGRDDLAAAGMNVDNVNPNTLEMMYRGQPVAYQFVGNDNDQFEEGEAIRFYGWAFDGSRDEQQFVAENVFWLWPNGAAARITTLPGGSAATPAPSFRAEVTRAPQSQYSNTRMDEAAWAASPNEPDAWYWEFIDRTGVVTTTVHTITRTIDVPHPAASGDASLTVELLSYALSGDVMVSMGPGFTYTTTKNWIGVRNDNIVLNLPASALQHGENQVRLTFSNQNVNRIQFFLNRLTVSYPRQFVAENDLLIFQGEAGNHTYQVSEFTESTTPLVWEIGNRLQPRSVAQVTVTPQGGGSATYTFHSGTAGSAFVATNTQAVKAPASISSYVAPSLDPAGGADWLAIIDPDFAAPTNTLAVHRQDPLFGGLTTAAVSIADVINQYGHGLPLPDAIRNYLAHALYTWPVAPGYVLLVGDATMNPNHVTCDASYWLCPIWGDSSARNHVPTHLLFKDRFQGHVPTDYPNALLAGDDLLPDLAIGRLAVESVEEANNIVAKIIGYETAHLTPGPVQNSIVFLSDNPDGGGNFADESQRIADLLPGDFAVTMVDQADASAAAVSAARTAVRDALHAPNGATVLNYRGHGSRIAWADNLFNVNEPANWPWPSPPVAPWLESEPLVILSLDCLDGSFVYPGQDALSETFHALPGKGSVAHWSSTGLGYTFEHRQLHEQFYKAVLDHRILPVGDIINYTKAEYAALVLSGSVFHESELWTFTLQGDPAMLLWQPREEPATLFLPMLRR